MKEDAREASGFQFGLVEAVGKAQAWLLTNEEVSDLENMTLGQERENISQLRWSSPVSLQVDFFHDRLHAIINNQYSAQDLQALRLKLAQYPKGTRFSLHIFGRAAQVDTALAALDDMAGAYGLQIDRAPTE
jgi:hypothetical protein